MTLDQVTAKSPIDRPTLHRRLEEWFAATATVEATNPTIGPIEKSDGPIGVTAWVHVRDEDANLFCLHADVRRTSVGKYLELVDQHGDALNWTIVKNQRGKENAVAYGPELIRITPFYLYLVKRS